MPGSGYDDLNPAKFALARYDAKQRAANQWLNWNFNMWKVYNTELNSTWVDPWHESELSPLPAPDSDPNNQILQNMYFIYCWLSSHDYCTYAMIGMVSALMQESTLTGGAWEGGYHPYKGNSLIEYDAALNGQVWYQGSSRTPVPGYTLSAINETYNSQTGQIEQTTYYKSAADGSWDAIRGYTQLQTYWVEIPNPQDPDNPLHLQKVKLGSDGEPLWDQDPNTWSGYKGAGQGYGLAQWTPYTKLRQMCTNLVGYPGTIHWQLNPTLQLMCMEAQRNQTITPVVWQSSGFSTSPPPNRDLPFFTNPFTNDYVNLDIRAGHSPITWDDYATGSIWEPWFDTQVAAIETEQGQQMTTEQKNWAHRELALHIWRICYEGAPYTLYSAVTTWPQKTLFVESAITYWDANGGWNIADIPRARDIPETDLDKYHLQPALMFDIWGRRKKKHVRAVLL